VLLLAHAYTRYLGDLSGGQLLAGVVRRALSLTSAEGTAFFEFAQLGDLTAFKAEYRRRLDAVPLTDSDAQRVVEEAVAAFGYNQALTDELTPALQQSLGAARFAELSTPVSR
jgi:heme oxygenase